MSYETIMSNDLKKRFDDLLRGFQVSQENNTGLAGAIKESGLSEDVFRNTLKEMKVYDRNIYKEISSHLGIEDIGDMF